MSDPFRISASDALQFPKVTVRSGIHEYAGYLTELSSKMLIIELERMGYKVTDARSAAVQYVDR